MEIREIRQSYKHPVVAYLAAYWLGFLSGFCIRSNFDSCFGLLMAAGSTAELWSLEILPPSPGPVDEGAAEAAGGYVDRDLQMPRSARMDSLLGFQNSLYANSVESEATQSHTVYV